MTTRWVGSPEPLKAHLCQHGLGEEVHRTVRIDELQALVESLPCCSKAGRTDRRHDPGCWSGCKSTILSILPAVSE